LWFFYKTIKGVEGGSATRPGFPRIIDGASVGVLTIGKERRERRDKEIGHGDTGGITVFGKKTEGTGAVEGRKNGS
jgi:hypothetical protein